MSDDETRVGHCKIDSTDTYIGRGPGGRDMTDTPVGERGWLGNPFSLEDGYTRDESIDTFRDVFYDKLSRDPEFREAVGDLEGNTLGCWCQHLDEDSPTCHGEVIAEYVNSVETGMQCHDCNTTHDSWTKQGTHAVNDDHNAGTITRWKCGGCGSHEEVPEQ